MESFGFDFSNDSLNFDWMSSSPNGTSNNVPFSIGTPTGIQSLGDDPFGGDLSSFMDSPNANANANANPHTNTNPNTNPNASASATAATTSTSATASSTAATSKGSADGSGASSGASAAMAMPDKKVKNESTAAHSARQPQHQAHPQSQAPNANATSVDRKIKEAPPTSSTSNAGTSSTDASAMGYANARNAPSSAAQSFNGSKPSASPGSAAARSNVKAHPGTAHAPNASAAMTVPMSQAPTSVSSSRPHIDGSSSNAAAAATSRGTVTSAPQDRYPPNQMGGNQQPHGQVPMYPGQPQQPYAMNGQGNPMGMPGQPPMQPNGQYMQPQFRPSNSVYDEEMMRVKSMMMQHPDLIPPPVEVLRVSMARSSVSPGMMQGAPNYVPARMSPQNQMINRLGMMPGYGQNPGMMMPGNQPPIMDPRVQRPGQIANPRPSRTSGSNTPDVHTAWQSENDLPLRRRMIGKIVSLLQQRKPDAPAEWIRRLPDMARRLEDSLYRTAKNRDEYGDFSSLKTRLQHLAVTMGARAQSKGNARPVGTVPGAPSNMMAQMSAQMNAQPSPASAAMASNMAMAGMPAGMVAQGMGNMAYGNPMAQQQMQMMQNPQMRQQLTPQQFQQLQAAQMQRRQYQMQQAQMQQRQSMQQPQQQQAQQYQQNQAMQRSNAVRGQSGGQPNQLQMQQMNQAQAAFMQQSGQGPNMPPGQGQSHDQGQNAQQQRGLNSSARPNDVSAGLGQGLVSDSADFLNLDLSQSFMNDDDLDAGLGDPMKGEHSLAGSKRTLAQSQTQMAAAANAAAFKRSKVAGASQGADSQSSGQGAGGSSKTPSMGTVNAK